MKGYIHKIPRLVNVLSKDLIWNIDWEPQSLFLTFDDGPNPKTTLLILHILRQFNAKATFFCQGDQILRYPEIYQQIIKEGHAVGNHTYNHVSGWKTPEEEYYKNVEQCHLFVGSSLFRPPYGQITRRQIQTLRKKYYLIMYNIISGDFDSKLSFQTCYKKTTQYASPGDIILFHDNLKSANKIEKLLNLCLEYWVKKELLFKAITPALLSKHHQKNNDVKSF